MRMLFVDVFKQTLANVPTDVRIDWSGYCEPFQNPCALYMMEYARSMGYRQALYSTLVGVNDSDLGRISAIPFDPISIHLPDEEQFVRKDAADLSDKAKHLKTMRHDADLMALGTPDKLVQVQVRIPSLLSRASNNKGMEQSPRSGHMRCIRTSTFSQNVMLPNGDVYLCCCDYSLKHKIGNLIDTHYDYLDRSSIMELADKESSDIICRNCEWSKT